jgi:nucleoside-diphosphate-sugar epimerase
MRIAILGATSQIAKDLIIAFAKQGTHELALYARRPTQVREWLKSKKLNCECLISDLEAFSKGTNFGAILNFVGVGDPAKAIQMGGSIFDVTLKYDELALEYVRSNPGCKYIFLSSGAAYGSAFRAPVDQFSSACIYINNLQLQDWYAVSKMHAECRHRSLPELAIIDVRVFNYFSHTHDIESRYLIADILRAIRDDQIFKTSTQNIVRDYLHPDDFFNLINVILTNPVSNQALDCYSRGPIDKNSLLKLMSEEFGLKYEFHSEKPINSASDLTNITNETSVSNLIMGKENYYSLNKRAANIGYFPIHNSAECIRIESQKLLESLDS